MRGGLRYERGRKYSLPDVQITRDEWHIIKKTPLRHLSALVTLVIEFVKKHRIEYLFLIVETKLISIMIMEALL